MICKLCHKEKKLVGKSHIIPDFMYHGIFDEKHRIIIAGLEKFQKLNFQQTGITESNILCHNCEHELLGELEKYASKALYSNVLPPTQQIHIEKGIKSDGLNVLKVSNLNYYKFKSFLLSILWRTNISKHHFFSEIALKPNIEEHIRETLLNKENIPEEDFRICMLLYPGSMDDASAKVISQPKRKGSFHDQWFYVFFINTMFYIIEVKKVNRPSWFEVSNLKIDNTIEIPIIDHEMFGQIINHLYT